MGDENKLNLDINWDTIEITSIFEDKCSFDYSKIN